jgi:hypothetical protein
MTQAFVLKLLRRLYQPFGRVPYAVAVFLFVDGPVGQYTHQELTGKSAWPGPPWTVVAFYVPLVIYATSCRFLDIGLPWWSAVPYSILTFSPYLLLFQNPTMNFWIPTVGAIIFQLPAMLLQRRKAV